MTWKDRTARHNLSMIICFISGAIAAAIILTGLVGVIWGTVEVVRQIASWF